MLLITAVTTRRRRAAAYLSFSREQPAAYRTLMGVVGEVHDWAPDELPGIESFTVLHDAVVDVRRTQTGEALVAAAAIWAQLHGIAELTHNKPTFPWPPTDALLDHVVASARA